MYKKTDDCSSDFYQLVPGTGIEPVWYRYRRILSPVRLPVPPPGRQMVTLRRFELRTP